MKKIHYILITICTFLILTLGTAWYAQYTKYNKQHPTYKEVCSDYNMARVWLMIIPSSGNPGDENIDSAIRYTQKKYNIKGHYSGYVNEYYESPICHLTSNHNVFNDWMRYDTRDLFVYYNPASKEWTALEKYNSEDINCNCGSNKPYCEDDRVKPCVAKIIGSGGTMAMAAELCRCKELKLN